MKTGKLIQHLRNKNWGALKDQSCFYTTECPYCGKQMLVIYGLPDLKAKGYYVRHCSCKNKFLVFYGTTPLEVLTIRLKVEDEEHTTK